MLLPSMRADPTMALSLIRSKKKQTGPINGVVDQAVLPEIAYSGMPLDTHHAAIDLNLDHRGGMDAQILRVIMGVGLAPLPYAKDDQLSIIPHHELFRDSPGRITVTVKQPGLLRCTDWLHDHAVPSLENKMKQIHAVPVSQRGGDPVWHRGTGAIRHLMSRLRFWKGTPAPATFPRYLSTPPSRLRCALAGRAILSESFDIFYLMLADEPVDSPAALILLPTQQNIHAVFSTPALELKPCARMRGAHET
ncbi:hypothetical protein PVAR5_2856 [Paecilomyces variotii No. 5]|uniref:Uncharacterized protein n=1 Tax=Byssochlamys spectabilis (strain No. 5 / NBRC 109023) TaxID=1356009 RepID=V5G029_BYSSN|nr:hypothetical protein PVAR5_2856 [Paecilomyces variotii No. 5]